jgi:hypothetical protein
VGAREWRRRWKGCFQNTSPRTSVPRKAPVKGQRRSSLSIILNNRPRLSPHIGDLPSINLPANSSDVVSRKDPRILERKDPSIER